MTIYARNQRVCCEDSRGRLAIAAICSPFVLAGAALDALAQPFEPGFRASIRSQNSAPASQVPDPEIAVGQNRIVTINNDEIAFFDLSMSGVPIHKRFVRPGFPGGGNGFFEAASVSQADPEVLYDRYHQRWWTCMFAHWIDFGYAGMVIAVSDDIDPSGINDPQPTPEGVWRKWYYTDFGYVHLDSPNLAVDKDRVYLAGVLRDVINGDLTDVAYRVYAWPKSVLMNTPTPNPPQLLPTPEIYTFPFGTAVPWYPAYSLVQRFTFDGSPLYTIDAAKANSNQIELRAIRFPATPPGPPVVSVYVLTLPTGFEYAPPVFAPQDGTNLDIATYDARFWGTPVYHNGSVWACHHVTPQSGPVTNRVQWYQIDMHGWPDTDQLPTLVQAGKIEPAGKHAIFPSLAPGLLGDMCLTYAVTSNTEFPSIRRAMRKGTDPLGTLPNDLAVQISTSPWTVPYGFENCVRWGDYSGTDHGAGNRCHFYGTHEYYRIDGSQTPPTDDLWRLWVGRFNVCASDFNDNGEIASDDLIAFADLYSTGDEKADVNQDAWLDAVDGMIAVELVTQGLP